MYRWVWDHLPGPTWLRAGLAAVAAAVAIAALLLVVPAVRPAPVAPAGDGSGGDQDQVVEPDGVRQSSIAPAIEPTPTPSVPGDDVPQQ